MAKKKVPTSQWHDGTTPIDELGETELMAHELVSEHLDLTPSVVRIMDAELDDEQRHAALTAFRASLSELGDPNRDPRVAIANAAR